MLNDLWEGIFITEIYKVNLEAATHRCGGFYNEGIKMMSSPPGEGPDSEAEPLLLSAFWPNSTLTAETFTFLFLNVSSWFGFLLSFFFLFIPALLARSRLDGFYL